MAFTGFSLLYVIVSQQYDKTICGQSDYYNQKQTKILSFNMDKSDFLPQVPPTVFERETNIAY